MSDEITKEIALNLQAPITQLRESMQAMVTAMQELSALVREERERVTALAHIAHDTNDNFAKCVAVIDQRLNALEAFARKTEGTHEVFSKGLSALGNSVTASISDLDRRVSAIEKLSGAQR